MSFRYYLLMVKTLDMPGKVLQLMCVLEPGKTVWHYDTEFAASLVVNNTLIGALPRKLVRVARRPDKRGWFLTKSSGICLPKMPALHRALRPDLLDKVEFELRVEIQRVVNSYVVVGSRYTVAWDCVTQQMFTPLEGVVPYLRLIGWMERLGVDPIGACYRVKSSLCRLLP